MLGLYSGTRTSAERLLWPQVTKLGASSPPHRRLYEFTNWLVTAVISGAWRSRPGNELATDLGQLVLRTRRRRTRSTSPSKSDMWVCIPEPG